MKNVRLHDLAIANIFVVHDCACFFVVHDFRAQSGKEGICLHQRSRCLRPSSHDRPPGGSDAAIFAFMLSLASSRRCFTSVWYRRSPAAAATGVFLQLWGGGPPSWPVSTPSPLQGLSHGFPLRGAESCWGCRSCRRRHKRSAAADGPCLPLRMASTTQARVARCVCHGWPPAAAGGPLSSPREGLPRPAIAAGERCRAAASRRTSLQHRRRGRPRGEQRPGGGNVPL